MIIAAARSDLDTRGIGTTVSRLKLAFGLLISPTGQVAHSIPLCDPVQYTCKAVIFVGVTRLHSRVRDRRAPEVRLCCDAHPRSLPPSHAQASFLLPRRGQLQNRYLFDIQLIPDDVGCAVGLAHRRGQ